MTFRNLILCSLLASLTGCKSTDGDTEPGPFVQTHPYVALTESARAHIDVQRTLAGGESILSFIETEADAEFEEVAPDTWDAGIYGDHAFIAETNDFTGIRRTVAGCASSRSRSSWERIGMISQLGDQYSDAITSDAFCNSMGFHAGL